MAVQKTPDPFLNPGEVSVDNTGGWGKILQAQGWIAAQSGDDVTISSATFGTFSSDRNSAYFTLIPPAGDQQRSNAWVGDAQNSGVMLLKNPPVASAGSLLREVCAFFSIDTKAPTPLQSLLAKIDDNLNGTGTDVIKLKVVDVPDWITEPNKKPVISRDVNAGLPTNALWCISKDSVYLSKVTMSYHFDTGTSVNDVVNRAFSWAGSKFNGFKAALSDTITSLVLTLSKTTIYGLINPADTSAMIDVTTLTISFNISGFNFSIDLASHSRKLLLTPIPSQSSIKAILQQFLAGSNNIDDHMLSHFPGGDGSDPLSLLLDHFHLWYIQVTDDTSQPSPKNLQWGVGILSFWTPNSTPICIALTYDSGTSTFLGRLMFQQDFADAEDLRSPEWDPRLSPNAILTNEGFTVASFGTSLDLWQLVGLSAADQPPIPTNLSSAEVILSKVTQPVAGSLFCFSAKLTGANNSSVTGQAPTGFSWDTASIDASIFSPATDKTKKQYTLDVFTTFSLRPPTGVAIPPALFSLGFHYDKSFTGSSWLLHASAANLSVGLLESFFDTSAQSGVSSVLANLNLKTLDILYTYKGKAASSFVMTGVLTLGALELDLGYQYVSSQTSSGDATAADVYKQKGGTLPKGTPPQTTTGWTFYASLSVNSPSSTVKDIANSILANSGDRLPPFVGNINLSTAAGGSPRIELQYQSKTDDATKGNTSTLSVYVNIAGFSLTFVQYQIPEQTVNGKKIAAIRKRLLRVAVDQIPLMHDIPLIGQLPQPFDYLEYLWVEDENPADIDSTLKGVTRAELKTVKAQCLADVPDFLFKETKTTPNDADIVIQAGHHFIVIVKGNCVLDHVFSTTPSSAKNDSALNPRSKLVVPHENVVTTGSGRAFVIKEDSTPAPEAPPTKGAAVVSVGPLSITAFTVQYKNGSLFVTVDATLQLGPIAFSVIDFTIELEVNQITLDNLAGIITNNLIHVSLHGIDVDLHQGALTLAGVFIHDSTATQEIYSGGIAVGFAAWQVLAIGQYLIQAPVGNQDGFRSVFIYGKLDGPLIELEFATIEGVRLGFGYNYGVLMPTLEQLSTYPFVSDSAVKAAGNDPMTVLNAMVLQPPHYVYPKNGSGWFCAGMTIKAFEMLSLTAVIMVDIDTGKSDPNDKGVVLGLFGDGVFQMEPDAPPDFSLFYIELIVGVEMDFVKGFIAAMATLAPSSHVYVPQAHLFGSAAFYSWFGNNVHAGDWVASVGGYSRSYQIPAHYPAPGRIGLNFTVGDDIQLIGQGYMAVTPKCAMAGGSLHLSLSVGPVSAYADLVFDAFINFKPFHFRTEISLSVGVECDIDILFIHIHVSIHLGADLTIWGPNDFGGHAWVDFWFFGFGIDFGASENQVQPLHLLEFYDLLKTSGPPASAPANDTVGADPEFVQHKYTVEAGLIPASVPGADPNGNFPSTGATTKPQVQAGTLQIRVDTPFSLSQAHYLVPAPTKADPTATTTDEITLPSLSDGTVPPTPPVYSKPMRNNTPITSIMEISVFNLNNPKNHILQEGFRGELVLKAVPTANWAAYNSADDPLVTNQPSNLQNGNGSTVNLVQGVRILPPLPHKADSPIIDFDATAAMKEEVPGSPYPLPTAESQSAIFDATFFEPELTDQTKRWSEFAAMWNAQNIINKPALTPKPLPAVPAVADIPSVSAAMLAEIVEILEWNIRPPAQMTRNNPPSTSASGGAGTGGTTTPPTPIPNVPQVNLDGRTDWQLVDEAPTQLIRDFDTYYPALPFVATAKA